MTYSTLIDGCVRAGAVDTGKELLREMVAAGVKPNSVTYNTLLRAAAMDDKVELQVCHALSSCVWDAVSGMFACMGCITLQLCLF